MPAFRACSTPARGSARWRRSVVEIMAGYQRVYRLNLYASA